jgi:putative transposase
VKYAWIEPNRTHWPVSLSLRGAGREPQRIPRPSALRSSRPSRATLAMTRCWCTSEPCTPSTGEYGWPRVWKQLLARGIRVGKERVRKLMKLHGIKARGKRKFKATTDSNHGLPVAAEPAEPGLLAGDARIAVWTATSRT